MKRFFLLYLLFLTLCSANTPDFTRQQQEWIDNHTVTVGIDSWSPIIFMNKRGEVDGISGEILRLIIERSGLQVRFVSKPWTQMLQQLKAGEIDLLPGAYYTKERAEYGFYSDPYYKMKEYIFVREQNSKINGFEDLRGKKIALIKDYGTIPKIRENYPEIEIVFTETLEEAIDLVLEGRVSAYIGAQVTVLNYLYENVITGIKALPQSALPASGLHLLTSRKSPMLHAILNKTYEQISQREINAIIAKWLHTNRSGDEKFLQLLSKSERRYL